MLIIENYLKKRPEKFAKLHINNTCRLAPVSIVKNTMLLGWTEHENNPDLKEQKLMRFKLFPMVVTFKDKANMFEEMKKPITQLCILEKIKTLENLNQVIIPANFISYNEQKIKFNFIIEENSELAAIFLTSGLTKKSINEAIAVAIENISDNIDNQCRQIIAKINA